jgi:hypothetical protein
MCVSREAGLEITPPTFRKNTFVSTGVDVLFGQNVIDVFFAGSGRIDPNDVILE